jgi:hypothetical protein
VRALVFRGLGVAVAGAVDDVEPAVDPVPEEGLGTSRGLDTRAICVFRRALRRLDLIMLERPSTAMAGRCSLGRSPTACPSNPRTTDWPRRIRPFDEPLGP